MSAYDPLNFVPLRFHTALALFRSGKDTPRAYLERCLETIAARELTVRAWVVLNEARARAGGCQHVPLAGRRSTVMHRWDADRHFRMAA
jgi:hypothetical protein